MTRRRRPLKIHRVIFGVVAVCLLGASVFGAPRQHIISGFVQTSGGSGVEGMSVVGNNGASSTVTATNGAYSVTVPNNWSGIITVSKAGWLITPASKTYSRIRGSIANENYVAYQPTISGYVKKADGTALSGASVSASGAASTITDDSGYYAITVPYNWSGSVSVSLVGYSFADKNYTNIITDQPNQDFTGYQPTISGYVRKTDGTALSGATITASNGGGSGITDVNGYYEIIVPYDWSGTVTAKRVAWQITPASYSYNNLTADELNQDFTAIYVGIIVKADGAGDYPTIQAAIDAAVNGDAVMLQMGTFTGNGNRDIDFKGKAITVRGATGDPNDCIIDCQADINNPHRGFKFASGEDTNSILEGVTIINGYGPSEAFFVPGSGIWIFSVAGGILCRNSGPLIINCIIKSNTTWNMGGGIYNYESDTVIKNCIFISNFINDIGDSGGAGIFNEDSNIILTGCLFFGNSSYQPGGGVYNFHSIGDINNCKFDNNVAGLCGGGINNDDSNVSIRNCSFTNNSMTESSRGGGGVANHYGSIVTISNCNFINNEGYNGGGVWNYRSSIELKGCEFIGNTGRRDGGGLYVYFSGSPPVNNCSFVDNTAMSGGGILNYYTDMKLSNSYFSNNTASQHGGGMYSLNISSPILKNCTFTGNSATWGGGLCNMLGLGGSYEINIKNCIIWGNSPDQVYNNGRMNISYSDIQNSWEGIGNINADPLFADGYHLIGYSPCINAGDPNYTPDVNETDIDGELRIVGGRIDMGADEFVCVGDFDGNGQENFADYAVFAAAWLSEPNDYNWDPNCDISEPNDDIIDERDLEVFVENWLAGI